MGKFDGVDFRVLPVQSLDPESPPDGAGFRPVRPEFATCWKRGRILREVKADLNQCWYLEHTGSLAGYITLLADRFFADAALLVDEGIKYKSFPAVKIGLLAADDRAKGAGKRLMLWALDYIVKKVAPAVGVRFATVDALFDPDTGNDTSGYYQRFGFTLITTDNAPDNTMPFRTMFLDLKPLLDRHRAFLAGDRKL